MLRQGLASRGSRLGLGLDRVRAVATWTWCRDQARRAGSPGARSVRPRLGHCARAMCAHDLGTVRATQRSSAQVEYTCAHTVHTAQSWVWVTIHGHCSLTLFKKKKKKPLGLWGVTGLTIKCICFESIYYAINPNVVSSFMVFIDFDFMFLSMYY